MGYLLQIVLALAAQAAAELGLETGLEWPWGVALLGLVPYVGAGFARAVGLKGRFVLAGRLGRLVALLPPALFLAALALFGWRRTVERWTGVEQVSLFAWPTFALLVVMAPFALYTLLGIDAQARFSPGSPRYRLSLRGLHLRMFASALVPVLAYLVGSAALGLSPWLQVHVEEISLWGALFTALFFALLLLVLPLVLRNTWDTRPVPPGPLRELLERVAELAAFRCREILVWQTGHLMANAAIVGLGARQRVVLFSDSLLAQLRPRELAAVFAHEIGHAKRRHVLVFLVWSAGFLLTADLLATRLDPEGGLLALGAMAAALALWFLGFGWLSRRFELDADLYSYELLGDPWSLSVALERLGGTLRDVASWRHFSPKERAAFLDRAAAEPGFAQRFRRRLRRWSALGLVVLVIAVVLQLGELGREYPAELVVVEQRLGDGESATRRAAGLRAEGRDLRRLAERSELEAWDALEAGRVEEAAGWLALGRETGDERLGRIAAGLDEARAGRADLVAAVLEEREPDWWRLLRARVLEAGRQGSRP